ncbi:hypothetical protein OK414_14785 [Priestia sp. JV24]|uniref:hypothetical protein n=1 Tax=Priestia TaxID=2800373 RepID=UPI0021D68459|nr:MULTISPECIES: hypothetical protein [Priestia]MCU7712483.1 hypothetical protein [Priestia megaterium]MCW1046312.1 hypothetical protein [Priestia sp. JV24]
MYQAGNSVEQVFGGSVIKQGDRTPLGFNFRDENGELVSLTGAKVQFKMASKKGVVVEKQATISDEYTVTFSLGEADITGAGDMMIEFIVTYSNGLQEKFPSDDWQRIRITPTLEDIEKYGVGYITFEKLTGEFQNQFDEYKGNVDEQIDSQKQRVDNLIQSTPQPSEVVDARFDEEGNLFASLKDHLVDKGNKIKENTDEIGTDVRRYKTLVPSYNTLSDIYAGDWSDALQQAFTDAGFKKNKKVLIPNADLKVTKQLVIPSGVKLSSPGGKLIRSYTRQQGAGTWLKFLGRNVVNGLSFDGGSDKLSVVAGEEIYYTDVDCDWAEGYVTLIDCSFENSVGASVIASQYKLKVSSCDFGDFGDHNIYVGGRSWQDSRVPQSVIIEGCSFTQTNGVAKDAVKIRNGCKQLILDANTFDIDGYVFGVWNSNDTELNSFPHKKNNKVIVSNNIVIRCMDFVIGGGWLGGGTEELIVNGNNVTATRNFISLGRITYGFNVKKVSVSNNTVKTDKIGMINGWLGGEIESVLFSDNEIEYASSVGLETYGNIRRLKIHGGRIKNTAVFDYGNRLIDICPNSEDYYATIKGHYMVDNVNLDGEISCIFRELNSAPRTKTFVTMDLTARHIHWDSQNAKRVFNIQGENTSSITTVGRDLHNILVNGTRIPNEFKQINLVRVDYRQSNGGSLTFSGDGTTTSKVIPHGLNGTPTMYYVGATNNAAGTAGIRNYTADATNITVYFNTAPAAGTNNVRVVWKAEL